MNEEEFFDALEYAYKNEVVSLVWEGRGRGRGGGGGLGVVRLSDTLCVSLSCGSYLGVQRTPHLCLAVIRY